MTDLRQTNEAGSVNSTVGENVTAFKASLAVVKGGNGRSPFKWGFEERCSGILMGFHV